MKEEVIYVKMLEIAEASGISLDSLPSINQSNDYAKPYIELFNGIAYYVIRERGIEYTRLIYDDIDLLLRKIFEDIVEEMNLVAKKDKERLNNNLKKYLKV